MIKNLKEGDKLIYHGKDESFPLDNTYAKTKLKKGKVYTIEYTDIDEINNFNNTVCFKEDFATDWDMVLFNTISEYIQELLNTYSSEYISLCSQNGLLLCKFNKVKKVDHSRNCILLYNETDFLGEISINLISSVVIDSYEDIVIYLDM